MEGRPLTIERAETQALEALPISGEGITALGALVLAAVGGYGGRDVFEMLVHRLGLAKPEARAVNRDRTQQDSDSKTAPHDAMKNDK